MEAAMKKFIISILCVAVFFIGLDGLIQDAGARFKSDERSLALIKQAQTAIGGETSLRNVRSLSIVGNVTKTFNFDGLTRTVQGELEINLQLPNQFAKMMKMRHEANSTGGKSGDFKKEVNVIVMNSGDGEGFKVMNSGDGEGFKQLDPNGEKQNVVIVRKSGADKALFGDKDADGKVRKIITDENVDVLRGGGAFQQNEMFRTTLALLLNAAPETDFSYAGEGDVDGSSCDILEARNGNSTVKLFLDKFTHLPRMMSYQGHKPSILRITTDVMKNESNAKVFTGKLDNPELAEFQIRFSDYRAVNGVLLPHRWTQTLGGIADEIVDVTSYEINPANIAEKFQNLPPKVMVRTEKN